MCTSDVIYVKQILIKDDYVFGFIQFIELFHKQRVKKLNKLEMLNQTILHVRKQLCNII